ncbi:MAG: hypothetical protein M3N56_09660, partial [Actinomycetota bacterium]|nr:hypothetical protein [Actinomycetota bacterium]
MRAREEIRCAGTKRDGSPCTAKALPDALTCKWHGQKGGRPVIHGRFSTLPARMRELVERNRNDPGLFDLTDGLAFMEALLEEEGRRLAECDTPSFRARALELFEDERYGELGSLLATGQVSGADHERLHRMADRTQQRREAAWALKLARDHAINAEDLHKVMVRMLG